MKVIVNAHGYVGQSGGAGGAGVFLQHIVARLSQTCAVDVLIAPNSRAFEKSSGSVRFVELPHVSAEALNRLREGPTVVLDPYGGLPCHDFPEDLGLCIIIHDLMHLERPQFFGAAERQARSAGFASGIQRADAVVVFSSDQARAVRKFFPGAQPKVIPHLPYMTLRKRATSEAAEALVASLGEFIMFPAVQWPHKNHKTLIEAFSAYVRNTGSPLRLAICGGPCAETRFSFLPSATSVSANVVDLGRVDDATLDALISHARAVVFPTLYEGFGIPVLEAAHLGKMVVASRLDVFDEILGEPNYRAVADPLCHLQWVAAFEDIEGEARPLFEARSREVAGRLTVDSFGDAFVGVLTACAERYSGPGSYPNPAFPEGDRVKSSAVASLGFEDIYAIASSERGDVYPVLGAVRARRHASTFRSLTAGPSARQSLRSRYEVKASSRPANAKLYFSAWVRLRSARELDALHWSVNDTNVRDLLPELKDLHWKFVREPIPPAGHIDFRAVKDGRGEAAGFDIEIHDPAIVAQTPFAAPSEAAPERRLDAIVALGGPLASLTKAFVDIERVNSALGADARAATWTLIAPESLFPRDIEALKPPEHTRVFFVPDGRFTREGVSGLLTPYQPLDRLLLLDADDTPSLLGSENLEAIVGALGLAPTQSLRRLDLDRDTPSLWDARERGMFLDCGGRAGQPLPPLDRETIAALLSEPGPDSRPGFAVIETDRTGVLSHHATVTQLFLDGAKALGFRPVLGLHRNARGASDAAATWSGFGDQVYAVGSADAFCGELERFVADMGLGPQDVIFMHSLSPQIVLGAARFIAAHPATSPHFALRFFSTAEAMGGHGLSYTKILSSIEAVSSVRARMHVFCESANLIDYYETHVGRRFPLLLNPEHPTLARVRRSEWRDPALDFEGAPVLAYFGEAREEKGFDELPAILRDLLGSEAMSAFGFLIQTGANPGNDTPAVARARADLAELKLQYPDRLRTFESVDTPEQFYFLLKRATGVIAPYKRTAYARRGSGVTLEALQMGLDVFAWADTDLYATFHETGRLIGVSPSETFAAAILRRYASAAPNRPISNAPGLSRTPAEVCARMIALCGPAVAARTDRPRPPILWVGNDTFGEGCTAVFNAQKRALRALGRECLELFIPWPDPNWSGVSDGAYDTKVYGFDSLYEPRGLAWVARPLFTPEMRSLINEINAQGPTLRGLRTLNAHYATPEALKQAVAAHGVSNTLLNYVHLYPAIASFVPADQVICETHDILAHQHAVRRGGPVVMSEKIEEFMELQRFPRIVAINIEERKEMERACAPSEALWRASPYIPEAAPIEVPTSAGINDVEALLRLGGIPDDVAAPSKRMLTSYWSRSDLQSIFHLGSGKGRLAFFRWWALCGQFEIGEDFGLTRRQFNWFAGADGQGVPTSLRGMLILLLSLREDLMQAFASDGEIRFAELLAWARENVERESGFSPQRVVERGLAEYSGAPVQAARGTLPAVSAVLDADPIEASRSAADMQALCERIADIDGIDMSLIGSAHPANIKSFRWFITEVFFRYLEPRGHNLFIAGSACSQLEDFHHPRIILLGRCRRVEPLVRASLACPLPVVFGSGAPIKAISALAINGAVTVSDHIDRAMGLAKYGIPSFSEARPFAEDLIALLEDESARASRCERAHRYAAENLTFDGYVNFWREIWAHDPAPTVSPSPGHAAGGDRAPRAAAVGPGARVG